MTQEEIKKVNGQIDISYSVVCPHCDANLDDYYNKEWFDNTMGGDFPVDNGYDTQFEATCPECKKPFIIDGFRH